MRRYDPEPTARSSVERARATRDRSSLAVISIGAAASGSAVAETISRVTGRHPAAIGVGIVAGLIGGAGVLRLLSHVFPWIFRATKWEHEDTSRSAP